MFFNSDHIDVQKFPNLSEFEDDLDRAEYLQDTLTNHATNDGPSNNEHYKILRRHFIDNPKTKELLPDWIIRKRDLSHFWQFIKRKFDHKVIYSQNVT